MVAPIASATAVNRRAFPRAPAVPTGSDERPERTVRNNDPQKRPAKTTRKDDPQEQGRGPARSAKTERWRALAPRAPQPSTVHPQEMQTRRERHAHLRTALILALAGIVVSPRVATASAEERDEANISATAKSSPLPSTPANHRAARVLKLLERIEHTVKDTRYEHRTTIRSREGIYYWDCSAMAAYILAKVAPEARKALTRERPVARDFYQVIRQAPTRGAREGWRQLRRITDVRPGDVFAWKRPKDFPSKSTGHVGFVLEAPIPAPGKKNAYLVRIADATSLPHGDDTRDPKGEGGFGHGTILFTTDGDGHGTAYGWFGERSRGVIETPIAFGRLIR